MDWVPLVGPDYLRTHHIYQNLSVLSGLVWLSMHLQLRHTGTCTMSQMQCWYHPVGHRPRPFLLLLVTLDEGLDKLSSADVTV
eukprot:359498-Chlamydomonas_euryale.AAC.8